MSSALPSKNLGTATEEEKKAFLNSFDCVLSDCDGVLWLGRKALPGAVEMMNTFRAKGRRTFFLSNNSTQTRAEFVRKCRRLGFIAEEEDIVSTAWLAGQYLRDCAFSSKVYVVGSKAVQKELDCVGIPSFGIGEDWVKQEGKTLVPEKLALEENVGAVLIAYDPAFSIFKLAKAVSYLQDPKCLFIATNNDPTRVRPQGSTTVWPGTGPVLASVETAAEGRKAVLLGKPNCYALEVLKKRGIDLSRCLVIGDKCSTDIHFGTSAGMQTLLVLTGVSQFSDVERYWREGKTHLVPNYYSNSVQDVLEILNLP